MRKGRLGYWLALSCGAFPANGLQFDDGLPEAQQ